MMKAIYLFAILTGLATAAIHPTGPVYRSASAVNSSQVKQQQQQQQQQPQPQPLAEERESTAFQTAETVANPNAGPTSNSNIAVVPAANPHSAYTVVYYPDATQQQQQYASQQQQQYAPQQQQYAAAGAANTGYQQPATSSLVYSQPQQTGTNSVAYQQSQNPMDTWWTRYHVPDILVAGAALGLFVGGGTIIYQKFGTGVKSRALRELADLKSEDTSRIFKNVMGALKKYYGDSSYEA